MNFIVINSTKKFSVSLTAITWSGKLKSSLRYKKLSDITINHLKTRVGHHRY